MDVPLQDVLIGCYCKQTEEQLQVLQIRHPVNIIMQCTRSQKKTEYMGGFAEILWKSNHGNGTKLALDIT